MRASIKKKFSDMKQEFQMLRRVLDRFGVYIGFLVMVALFSVFSPNFLSARNISNIMVQSSILAIIAVGQTIVILTSGIELSVGSVAGFTSMFSAYLVAFSGFPVALGILTAILVSALIGCVNGVFVTYANVPAFIVTLGTMSMARGAALALTSGAPISGIPRGYEILASTDLFGAVPIFIIYCLIAYVAGYVFLTYTKTGRYIYAIGGNREAARLSGIKVRSIELLAYVICGTLSGIGGIMLTARLAYATPIAGIGYELDVIAAVVIGGTSMFGGEGKILGTLAGAIMLGTLRNGLTLFGVSPYFQSIIIGGVIIFAVFLDRIRSKRAA
jgi:ribose transport system permease protein